MANQNWLTFKKAKEYTYEGIKNNRKTKYGKFIKMCKMTQKKMKSYLVDVLKSAGYKPIVEDGFIFAEGSNVDVCLTAHMDTVHQAPVKDFYENVKQGKHILSSPQGIGGDDRCGIYIIYKIITKTDLRPTILFCEDEEIGGIGSGKFCETKLSYKLDNMKFLIELDRANANDAVYYNCYNVEFMDFIYDQTDYQETWGSFSDISNLAPECGVAAVNLSCGYYDAHTLGEYVVMEEMENTIAMTKRLLMKAQQEDCPKFQYVEDRRYDRRWYYDEYDDYNWSYTYFTQKNYNKKRIIILWTDGNDQYESEIYANSETEGLGEFFIENPELCYNDVLAFYED